MECGGKGSFQALKLQNPTQTTVCSHSADGMPITFHKIQHHHDDIQGEYLFRCEHLGMASFFIRHKVIGLQILGRCFA